MAEAKDNTSIRRRGVRESIGKVFIMAAVLALAGLALSACGNNKALDSGSSPGPSDPRSYFPNQAGYSVTFTVTDASGQEIRQEVFTATSTASFEGLPGMRWEGRNLSDSTVSAAGIIFWDNNAVYHQADGAAAAEALIVAPLEVGAYWARWRDFSDTTIIAGGTDPNIFDFGGGGGSGADITNGGGGLDIILSSSYPTTGSSTFYVAETDAVVQSGSQTFSACLQIINAGTGNKVNRYWYHQGDGLIKYALGCEFGVLTGTENAELVR